MQDKYLNHPQAIKEESESSCTGKRDGPILEKKSRSRLVLLKKMIRTRNICLIEYSAL